MKIKRVNPAEGHDDIPILSEDGREIGHYVPARRICVYLDHSYCMDVSLDGAREMARCVDKHERELTEIYERVKGR